jgi:geranylgeranylglycerol-phosphate geranylgeranyltransferase
MGFIKAYIKSMRPYSFLITGIGGLIGMLLVESSVSLLQKSVVLLLLFTSYGINQIINDLLGAKEDRINAPTRPLVSGELDKKKALIFTFFAFIIGAILTYLFNPYALIIYFTGYLANVIYEYIKGIPLVGNLWFGFMVGLTSIYGALAITNLTLYQILKIPELMGMFFLIALSSSALCYFTYFKDYEGDRQTGIKTLIVSLSPKYARYLNFVMSSIPFVVLLSFFYLNFWNLNPNIYFLILVPISFILFQCTALVYCFEKYNPKKALELNFQSAVLFQTSLITLISPLLAVMLSIASFLIIKIMFRIMYKKGLY